MGVAVGSGGNCVLDAASQTLRRIELSRRPGGWFEVNTLAGVPYSMMPGSANGNGIDARFTNPSGMALDSSGIVYIADTGSNTIRRGIGVPASYVLFNAETLQTLLRTGLGPTLPSGWKVACVADVNHDNQRDLILYHNDTRRTAIWFLNNSTLISGVFGPTLPAGWEVIALADVNRDGRLDYVLFNAGSRRTAIWYLNGTTLSGTAFGPTLPAGWVLKDALDFNANGAPDLLLFKLPFPEGNANDPTKGKTAIWYLNGPVFIGGVFGPYLRDDWTLEGAEDLNGDGQPDYVLFNELGQHETAIWYLHGATLGAGAYGPSLPPGYRLVAP
jgi:hypothetical protein